MADQDDTSDRTSAIPAWARGTQVRPHQEQAGPGPRLAIVGPCAAGKTTLVGHLRDDGYDAHAVAQEHSGVRYLWRLSEPDLLIFLDVDLAATRQRRRGDWPESLYCAQQERLADARDHADLYLDSSALTPQQVARQVADFVATARKK